MTDISSSYREMQEFQVQVAKKPFVTRKHFWAMIIISLAIAANGTLVLYFTAKTIFAEKPFIGDQDFFYSSFVSLRSGLNPYDLDTVEAVSEETFGVPAEYGTGYCYSPWSFIILAPVFAMAPVEYFKVWLVFNLILLLLTVVLMLDALEALSPQLFALAGFFVLIFPPSIDVMVWGQVGIITAFFLALSFWAYRKNHWIFGSVMLPFFVFKPQMSVLVLLVIIVWLIRNRRYLAVTSIFVTGFVLLGVMELVHQGIILQWVNGLIQSSSYAYTRHNMSLSRPVLELLHHFTGQYFLQVKPITALVGIIALAVCIIRSGARFSLTRWLPAIAAVTPLLSGYAWFHDSVLLVIPLVFLIAQAKLRFHQTRFMVVLATLASLFVIAFEAMAVLGVSYEWRLWWFSLAMAVIFFFYVKIFKTLPLRET